MIIGQSSQEVEFPAINTIEDTKELFWRRTALDDPAYISSNFEDEYEINFCALLGHNMATTAVIKAIGADDVDFTIGVVEERIDWVADNIFHFFSIWQTKQYWKIEISDPDNLEGYNEVATIVLGKFFEPNCNFEFGYRRGREDFSSLDYSDSMVLHAEEKSILFTGDFNFGSLNTASRDEVMALLAECGAHKGMVVCFNWTNAGATSYWIKLGRVAPPVNPKGVCWRWPMNIIEVK